MTTAILDFSKPHLLRDAAEYEAAITEIGRLLDQDVEPGSEGYDRLEFLSILYEVMGGERPAPQRRSLSLGAEN